MSRLYIFCILLSFFLSFLFAAIISRFGLRLGLVDAPNERSSHSLPTSRSGGMGIWIAFILTGLLCAQYNSFTILAGIIGLIGLLEDIFSISQKIRLVLHVFNSALVVILFLGVPNSIISILLLIFWSIFITGTANFYNFMDGIDGIAGLTGFVGFGLLAVFSFLLAEKADTVWISSILSAGCLGFLPFNFPKAKVFMGDVGSIFLGFVFASLLVKLSAGINEFLCMIMFLCMFYADAILTIFSRWRRGENLIMAHRTHLYQYMSNELNLPHWQVSLLYASLQFFFGLLALLAYITGLGWQLAVFGLFGMIFLVLYKCTMQMRSGLPLRWHNFIK